jgi:hypothetical protein
MQTAAGTSAGGITCTRTALLEMLLVIKTINASNAAAASMVTASATAGSAFQVGIPLRASRCAIRTALTYGGKTSS